MFKFVNSTNVNEPGKYKGGCVYTISSLKIITM